MTKVGTLSSLFFSPPTGRQASKELHLDGNGIINDKHYDKDRDRSVLLTSLDSYLLVKSHGIETEYGELGENLLMDYNPYRLPVGSRLKIAAVVLEISQPCTLCKSLSNIDSRVPKLLKKDRGVFAKVIEAGTIAEGDEIYLID